MAENGLKWLKIDGNGWKCLDMCKFWVDYLDYLDYLEYINQAMAAGETFKLEEKARAVGARSREQDENGLSWLEMAKSG